MSAAGRLAYIDWLRGLSVFFMILVHSYSGWLTPEAKRSSAYYWIRMSGGYPAAVFLFLAGLVLAMLLEARWHHAAPGRTVVLEGLRRGAEVFGYAILFRLWMFTTSGFGNPSDLLRVDVLNCIGLSMVLVALVGFGWRQRSHRIAACVALTSAVALATPAAWDAQWPSWIPRGLLGYVNGRVPGSVFALLPWGGFTPAGAVAGILLSGARRAGREQGMVKAISAAGVVAIGAAVLLEDLFPSRDFWRTSPQFFLQRLGLAMALLGVALVLSRGSGRSALRQFGATSLLVYWAHIEVVYGKLLLPDWRGSVGMAEATVGFVALTFGMLLLSTLRSMTVGRRPLDRLRQRHARQAHPPASVEAPPA